MKPINALVPLFCCWAILLMDASGQSGTASTSQPDDPSHDVVVYGDSSGAVIAAIASKREGRSVVWINPTNFAGGMSSSGLGATDFLGYRNTFGGIASEFYDLVAKAYGTTFVRSFEPHVGKQVFEQMIDDSGVAVVYGEQLDRTSGNGVTIQNNRIQAIKTLSGKTYRGKMFIDATYVGDLMAASGVTYTVGREPESQYGEDMAGVRRGDTNPRVHYGQKDKDHFVKEVDPYVVAGDPSSGLLPHIHHIEGLKNGTGDKKIQAYNYRVCLTTNPINLIPIEKPSGYREIDHELLLRNFDAGDTRLPALVEPLAGDGKKVDWNNMHAVGSDFPGANWEYPEASYERRREIEQEHENYIRGFLWTMSNSPRVPEEIRTRTAAYGLPKDEFTDNGGWPWMIYIREARRMVSDYVMTQLDCSGTRKAPDPIALGSFGMDSHCVQHIVTDNGKVQNEGVIWRTPPRPYGISYRSIIPSKGQCENLFSPICLSASHVAHGSIRMEPVFMALSESSAIAAGLAIDMNVSVQEVPYATLLGKLEAAKQIARPNAWKRQPTVKKKTLENPKQSPETSRAESNSRPNIVLVMADDLGYGSLGCYGNTDVATPNLDRLAARGMRLTDFHSNGALCSPTRAALLTGRYPQRCTEVPDAELSPVFRDQRKANPRQRWAWGIDSRELMLPAVINKSGYRTALIGKWHLGYDEKFHPMNYGFDEFRGFMGGNVDYHTHVAGYGLKELDWWNGRKTQNDEGYTTDLLTKYATDFIARNKNQSFFLFLSHASPHSPLQGRENTSDQSPVTVYKDMLRTLDESVGAVVKELQDQNIESNTLVIFCSDNGTAAPRGFEANACLRGKKGSVFEGGHRVPFIASWPNVIPAGATSGVPTMTMDLLPTLANLAGASLPEHVAIDGIDILPMLKGAPVDVPRDLHWQCGEDWAVRKGAMKLMGTRDRMLSLNNLERDIGEQVNLLSHEPQVAEDLRKRHYQWSESVSTKVASRPNVLLILADDMGVECLSAYGGTSHSTPHIDRLAKEGMRFTNCFSNPFCSPSRGSLLTGRYPFQNGLKVVLHSKSQENLYLKPTHPSFARQLKQNGYATQIVGKWHVSLEHKHNTIEEFGFDHYQTWQIFDEQGGKTTRYWNPYLMRDGRILDDEIKDRYGPDLDLEFHLDFIKSNAQSKTPFLAYYSTCLPHYPWEPTPDSKQQTYRATHSGHQGDPQYYPDMVAYLDKQIGLMLKTLDDHGIADNTVVLFLADNGTDRGLVNTWGDDKEIAGGKGTMTDRGTHVPLLVRWPGHVSSGSTCDDLVDLTDFLPTICELTGSELPSQTIHGRSFMNQLLGKPSTPRKWIHIQNGEDRQVRNHEYMLNNKNQLRGVVPLWQYPPKPKSGNDSEKESIARKELQAVFDSLAK